VAVLVLFDTETRVTFLDRCKEFVRGRDTWRNVVLEWLVRACSRTSRFPDRIALAVKTALKPGSEGLPTLLFYSVRNLALGMIFVFLLLAVRPFNPRGDGFGFVEWPSRKRTTFLQRSRPRPSKAFEFLQDWLSDPLHIKMLAYMTSGTGRCSHVDKLAEEAILWQMSRDSWKHEKNHLSLKSDILERQAIEKPNFNTLKQLVECRRRTRKLQDHLKQLHRQMPPITLD
jgi:hypothetical protein